MEEIIIADWLEASMIFLNTTIMVNTHRINEGLLIVGRSNVMSDAKRMIQVNTKV